MGDAATPTSSLICQEDGHDFLIDANHDAADGGGAFCLSAAAGEHFLDRDEEYVELLLSKERASSGAGSGQCEEMEDWMKAARAECIRWILKTNASFRFGVKTAYVAVTYLDRFLVPRSIDRGKEWALQLLSVACLSLAAKVEEHRAPLLPEFRLDEYEFNSSSILRMELLVLGTLKWQMITVTPFSYLSCLAVKFEPDERNALIRRAVECIVASLKVMNSVDYQPSTIAAAAILVARNKELTPNLMELKVFLGSLWEQLATEHVYSCYSVMIQEEKSMQSREVTSSNVSAAHIGSFDSSMDPNNVTTAVATPDNKRKRVHSPLAQ